MKVALGGLMSRIHVALFLLLAALPACGDVAHGGTNMDAGSSHAADATPAKHDAGGSLPDGSCRNNADCPNEANGQLCIGPSGPITFAACSEGTPCTADTQCDAGNVCMTSAVTGGPSLCNEGSGAFCQPKCQTGGCNYWATCDTSTGHCNALPCNMCPSYLSCANGQCGPESCKKDSDCSGGYCVDGECLGQLGYCGGPYG
jgi:hypothetical protein